MTMEQKQYTLEKSETTIKMFGIKDVQKHHMLTIHNREYVYTLDYITNEAGKVSIKDQMEMGEFMQTAYTEEQKEDIRNETLASMGGQISGTGSVLGRTCEIMEIAGSKNWFYKQISLKSETSVMGVTNNELAISMEENISIPASKFEPPAGVEFTDYTADSPWGGMEEDNDESNEILVEITKEQFCNAVNNAAFSGFIINSCTDIEGSYTAMCSYNGNMLVISPTHSDNIEKAKEYGEIPEDAEIFSINGHEAIYSSRIYDEEEEEYIDMPVLMIEFRKHNLYLTIAGMGALNKADLTSIAKRIHF